MTRTDDARFGCAALAARRQTMREMWRGPSPWTIGKCAACRQPIHFLAQEVVATRDGLSGTSFHARCFDLEWEQTDGP